MSKLKEQSSISKSQQKRLERKKEIESAKRKSKLAMISVVAVVFLLLAGIISLIGYSVYKNMSIIQPSSDYSQGLTSEGLIKDVTATDYVELADYSNIQVPLSEIEYSDESVETDIQTLLDNNATLDTETEALIADGDRVNIDYVGTIDGVEFEGGNTNGAGSDLKIGSDSLIEGFEDQLIGHGAGENVTVNVTFPTDYSDTAVAGKDAVFEVTINGIYSTPEFNDEFVQTNLSDYASTTEEYRTYLKDTNYASNLNTWLETYMTDNSTITSYPDDYIDYLKSVQKYQDQTSYEYMNSLYAQMGYDGYGSFEEYTGTTEAEYDAGLEATVQPTAKVNLIFQAIAETEGISATTDDYFDYFKTSTTEDYDSLIATYGENYVVQLILNQKVREYLVSVATVTE